MDDVSRGVGTGVSVGGVVGVADGGCVEVDVGVCVEVDVGVCVEVGGGVEVGKGVWVAVGFFASAASMALGVDVGGEVAVFFPAGGRAELANDRTASTPVSAYTQTLVNTTRSKTTTIFFFIN